MNQKTELQYLHAIKVAIIRGQKEFEGVKLPEPQKTGTATQQNSYAKQMAQTIFNEHFKEQFIKVPNSRFLEATSELANMVVVAKFGESATIEEDDEVRYTEEAQDFFNQTYDEVETKLINILKVKSDLN